MTFVDDNFFLQKIKDLDDEDNEINNETHNYYIDMINEQQNLLNKQKIENELILKINKDNEALQKDIYSLKNKIRKNENDSYLITKRGQNEINRLESEHKIKNQKIINEMENERAKAELQKSNNINNIKYNYMKDKNKIEEDRCYNNYLNDKKKYEYEDKKRQLNLKYQDKFLELNKESFNIKLDELNRRKEESLGMQKLNNQKIKDNLLINHGQKMALTKMNMDNFVENKKIDFLEHMIDNNAPEGNIIFAQYALNNLNNY